MKFPVRWIDVMVIVAIVGYAGYVSMGRGQTEHADAASFANDVNLDPLFATAVQGDGRLRSFESHAKTFMGYVSGPRVIHDQSYGFTYLDMMFRPEAYRDVDLIYVKNKSVRQQILGVLSSQGEMSPERAEEVQKVGLFSQGVFADPQVHALLQKLGEDLIRTAKEVDAINGALGVTDPRVLLSNLRLVAPPSGDSQARWYSMDELASAGGAPQDSVHAGMTTTVAIPGLDAKLQTKLSDAWSKLRGSWRLEDVAGINEQVASLASLLPTVAPGLYPSVDRLSMESWYFRYKSMTWVWLLYLVAVVPLLMSVIYKWDFARAVGMLLFVVAFLAQTASIGIRWYISGRWPNSNMFEAVTTAAWMGGVLAIILEYMVRKTAFRDLFALGSAVISMGALMAAYFLPAALDSGISNKMAALNDVWLYIHTNMIIWGYAVIGLACIPSLLLLRHRWCKAWDDGTIPKVRLFLLPVALAVLNYSAYLLLMHVIAHEKYGLSGNTLFATAGAFWSSLFVVMLEALGARDRRLAGAKVERAASGGASALMGGGAMLTGEKPTVAQVYDGATMVLVELSFIMLWTGIVMGAIWADHSWGRPWGWDPKEVFALNTFLIFLVLIHVRLKVKDRAFWTAILALVGFEVMMFNWIAVNFVITGLHSYA
jgi:cytochrome c-type biogenesis protein CcsB